MPEYRAYRVGQDGHFIGFEPLVCADDNEAAEKARSLVDGHDVELWSGERLVSRLKHQPQSKKWTNASVTRHIDGSILMIGPSRKDELERRLEQSRRLSKEASDPATKDRLNKLTDDLVKEQRNQDDKR
jgi:hypothetical protein